MKMLKNRSGFLPIAALCLMLLVGCRPDIELTSDLANVSPGSTVTLSWDVEFAKGSSSNKITMTPGVGQVETRGSYEVNLSETTEFELRVSSFVLGFPISAKERLSVKVLDEDYKQWTFEAGVDGWNKGYVFYHQSQEGDFLCDNSTETGIVNPAFNEALSAMGYSYFLCLNNQNNSLENPDTDLKHESLAYMYRKVTSADGFDIKPNQAYKIAYEIKYGIRFDQAGCNDLENDLSSYFYMLLAASQQAPSIQTHAGWRKLFFQELDDQGYDTGINSLQLAQLSENQGFMLIKNNIYKLSELDADASSLASGSERVNFQQRCEKNREFAALSSDIGTSANQIIQTSNGDGELWLVVGFGSNFEQGHKIEYFIDSISTQIIEQ